MNAGLVVGIVVAIIVGALLGFGISFAVLQPRVQNLQNDVNSLTQEVNRLNQTLTASNTTIKLGYLANIGYYFEGPEGLTLYYFALDVPSSGVSNCTGTCLTIWTPFYTPSVTLPANSPEPLNASDFGAITNPSGTKQTTYKGWPLYYFNNDTAPGQIGGQGFVDKWWVMKPGYTMMLDYKEAVGGLYLTDAYGRALYHFLNDTAGSGISNATSATLAHNWPPFYTDNPVEPSYLNATDFSAFTRSDGLKQTTYKGWPLYYFIDDTKPGDTNGQGLLNLWYAMPPSP